MDLWIYWWPLWYVEGIHDLNCYCQYNGCLPIEKSTHCRALRWKKVERGTLYFYHNSQSVIGAHVTKSDERTQKFSPQQSEISGYVHKARSKHWREVAVKGVRTKDEGRISERTKDWWLPKARWTGRKLVMGRQGYPVRDPCIGREVWPGTNINLNPPLQG